MEQSFNSFRNSLTAAGIAFEYKDDGPKRNYSYFTRVGRSKSWRPQFAMNERQFRLALLFRGWRFAHAGVPFPYPHKDVDYKAIDTMCMYRARHSKKPGMYEAATRVGSYLSWQSALAYKAWRLGYTNREIAQEFDVSVRVVAHVLTHILKAARDLGFPTFKAGNRKGQRSPGSGPARLPVDMLRMIELWNAGFSTSHVARELGVNMDIVRRRLREAGFTISNSEAVRRTWRDPKRKERIDAVARRARLNLHTPKVIKNRNEAIRAAWLRDSSDPVKRARRLNGFRTSWEKKRALLPPTEKVVGLYKDGQSIAKIATALGYTIGQIRGLLKKAGAYAPRSCVALKPQIVEMFKAGKTITEISEALDCSGATVRTTLKHDGVFVIRTSHTPKGTHSAKVAMMVEMWKAGQSAREIAAKAACDIQTARRLLKKAGVYTGYRYSAGAYSLTRKYETPQN